MDTVTTKPTNSLEKVFSFLTKPRGAVGKAQTLHQELQPRLNELDKAIASLNGDQNWFREKFCNGVCKEK